MKNRILVYGMMAGMLSACQPPDIIKEDVDQTWQLDVSQADTTLGRTISRVQYVALDTATVGNVYAADKVLVQDDRIYVADYRMGKIVAYNGQGRLRFVVQAKGAGPKEYLEMKTFCVDSQYLYVLDNYRHVVVMFDCQSGKFVQTKPLPFVAWDMEVLPDGHFIFAFIPFKEGRVNREQPRYKVFVTDADFEIQQGCFEYTADDYEAFGRNVYLTRFPKGVVFASMAADRFSLFYGKDSVEHIGLQLRHPIPAPYRKDSRKIAEEGYSYLSATPWMAFPYVALELDVEGNLQPYIYDVRTHKLLANARWNGSKFFLGATACSNGRFVYYLDNYSLYQELVSTGFARADHSTEKSLQQGGVALICYQMQGEQ